MPHGNQFLGLLIKQVVTMYYLFTQKSFSLAPKVFLTLLHITIIFLKNVPKRSLLSVFQNG